jgi:hypothetical protein
MADTDVVQPVPETVWMIEHFGQRHCLREMLPRLCSSPDSCHELPHWACAQTLESWPPNACAISAAASTEAKSVSSRTANSSVPERQPGTDSEGYAGLEDESHWPTGPVPLFEGAGRRLILESDFDRYLRELPTV